MKKQPNNLWPFFPIMALSVVALAIMTVLSFLYSNNIYIAYAEAGLTVILTVAMFVRFLTARSGMLKFINRTAAQFSSRASEILKRIPMATLITDNNGNIVWYNEIFAKKIADGEMYGFKYERVFSESNIVSLRNNGMTEFEKNGLEYTVYLSSYPEKTRGERFVFSFVENTALKKTEREYYATRPVAMIVEIDSLTDITANASESEIASMRAEVEKEIEDFAKNAGSFVRRLNNQRYILLFEERYLKSMLESKFSILDSVRAMTFNGEKGNVTLSIGVGRGGEDIKECENIARQSLDMALSRGGDQAAVKTEDGFEFFGGLSKGVEKRSKTKTRVIASALKELIVSSDNVLIMGHKFSDLDSLGAACALRKVAVNLGKNANIVLNIEQNLAKTLMNRIIENETDEEAIISEDSAVTLINQNTLLIIVDTHRAAFVESPVLYEKIKNTVVIDHHRKTVDFINDAVMFYHEPVSSSACEMVSELVQYMGKNLIGKFEAEALLAGIMLDTKNFILKTGVRTFEASGYLRSLGADPVSVKKMFSGSIEEYKEQSELVASAKFYGNCAISGGRPDGTVSRISASKAADELLGIDGVDASFVLFKTGDTINISARSMGKINVQIIMEKLGGGGHLTMAAAQLKNKTYEESIKNLIVAIDASKKEE